MSARDLDAEQEIDLGRYGRAIASRWWLPLAGLIAGAIFGYVISLGGNQVYRASATVYLGQPYSVVSSVALVGKQSNPASVSTIVRSEEAVQIAAAAAGMRSTDLRGTISTKSISAGVGSGTTATRTTANPLVRITVESSGARKARLAANSLARQVIAKLSVYGNRKIEGLKQRIANDQDQIDLIRRTIGGSGDAVSKAVLGLQLGDVQDDQLNAQQLLTQAEEIELPSLLTRAVAAKTTARSRRNSVVVAAFIGLLLGLIAALAWEPLMRRRTA